MGSTARKGMPMTDTLQFLFGLIFLYVSLKYILIYFGVAI